MPNLNLTINCQIVSVQRNTTVLYVKQITAENRKPGQEKTDREENVFTGKSTRQCPFSAQSERSFMFSHLSSYTKITFIHSLIK